MVLREGAEMALILRAVGLTADGAGVWMGTALGLVLATTVGLLFFQGTLKVPLGRFFAVTSWILVIVAAQLLLTGVHELSEAGWLPSSRAEMAILGPVVRNDIFFFAAILGVAALLVLREWASLGGAEALANAASEAERRRLAAERQRQGGWLIAGGATFVIVMLILTADFIYGRVSAAPPEARIVEAAAGSLRIPTAGLGDGNLHFFQADVQGTPQGFMVVRQPGGSWVAALDACMICGAHGYRQEGEHAICRNCAAAIHMSTMGDVGGCNPIAVPARVEGSELVLQVSDLSEGLRKIPE
jgi:uncharacterized membrane protein